MVIRHFTKKDYPAVQDIYQQGINTGNATFQLTVKSWDEWNSSMHNHCRLVAIENDNIVGWAALSPVSTRAVYSGVAEVGIYIATNAQGKGVGQKLLSHLVVESENNNIWTLQASIFPENRGSIKLHENNDFQQLGVRKKLGKLNGVWRDVTFMERRSKIIGI